MVREVPGLHNYVLSKITKKGPTYETKSRQNENETSFLEIVDQDNPPFKPFSCMWIKQGARLGQ